MADMSNKRFKIRCRVLSWCGLRPWKHLRNLQSRFSLSIHSVIMRLTRHGLSALGNGLVNSQNFAKGCMAFMHYNYVTDGFFSPLSCSVPTRRAPTGSDSTREKITEARWWSSPRTAPLCRTASISPRSTRSTCWRAPGSSTSCPTTGAGSSCWGQGITGATTTGGPWMPGWALWGESWISIEIGSPSSFLNLETNKVFSLCSWH